MNYLKINNILLRKVHYVTKFHTAAKFTEPSLLHNNTKTIILQISQSCYFYSYKQFAYHDLASH